MQGSAGVSRYVCVTEYGLCPQTRENSIPRVGLVSLKSRESSDGQAMTTDETKTQQTSRQAGGRSRAGRRRQTQNRRHDDTDATTIRTTRTTHRRRRHSEQKGEHGRGGGGEGERRGRRRVNEGKASRSSICVCLMFVCIVVFLLNPCFLKTRAVGCRRCRGRDGGKASPRQAAANELRHGVFLS